MRDFLKEVFREKTREVEELKRSGAQAAYKRTALAMPLPPSFHDALRVPRAPFAVIGEIKRSSPSAGVINANLDAAKQAKLYEEIGVSAISVLTDEQFFKGRPDDLLAAAQASALPVLCKDFIIDPVQVYRARAYGASAALLICELLDDERMRALMRVIHELSLDAVVECHGAEQLDRALRSKARIIGINARNLRTLEVDVSIPKRLAPKLPDWVVGVAESGIRDHRTLVELSDAGFAAFLIGEHLSGAADPRRAFEELMGTASGG